MGVAQTFAGLARVMAPILATIAFQRLGHGWPFYIAGGFVALVGILAFQVDVHPRLAKSAESLALAALVPLLPSTPSALPSHWDRTLPDPETAPPGALARALTGVIRQQYGTRLSAKDLATIATQIQSGLERVDQLRKVPLSNGDEPDFVFTARRT
jgi:hypothetical protein